MAVTLTYSNITIRGITYKKGSSFKCCEAHGGAAGSEGEGSAAALTKGTTYYVYAKASGSAVSHPYAVSTSSGGSIRGWYEENVFPYATYAVKFNANGGSGAPGTQTKTYGTTLTLSATKPARTGHTFKGWATSSSGSVVYSEATNMIYSSNAAITLYAVWQANTYTLTYNANGGSGAPSSQTKTYGKNLTLSSTKPTRTNYKFLGWSTSSTASVASYAAGDTYTNNGNATLYAVWELEYLPPTITSLKAIRCNINETTGESVANDFGTYALVTFDWECSQLLGLNNVSEITVAYAPEGSETWSDTPVTASDISGNVSITIGEGSLSIESKYQIKVTVVDTLKSDGLGTTTKSTIITAAIFSIDFLAGGKGVAIGQPASREGFDVGMPAYFNDYVKFTSQYKGIMSIDSNDNEYHQIQPINENGNCVIGYGMYDAVKNGTLPEDLQGNTNVYAGNNIRLCSASGGLEITSPTAGLSARQYGVNKVLWSGGYYMNGTQTATLSEAVSAQPNGIVLVFSQYSSGSQDAHFSEFFVPKGIVTAQPGVGHVFNVWLHNVWYTCTKYLYINDTIITGHTDNAKLNYTLADTSSTGRLTADGRYFVLRYVFGV